MEKIKIFHDKTGNTLTVWFGESREEYIAEETGEDVILMKDINGKVIGFEKINYLLDSTIDKNIIFEMISA